MAREKEKILFNKNHITIKFYENRQYIHGNTSQKVITGGSTIKNDYWSTHEKVKVKKVSKLAPFYYEVEEYKPKPGINSNVHSSGSEQRIVYIAAGDHAEYEIKYYTSYGDTSISHETRPWDVYPGDAIFEEHFITDIEKVLKEIFLNVNIDSIEFNGRTKNWWDTSHKVGDTGSKVRIEIMKDLFDDKDGYKKQTNESKILSHGFDLKESFRKRKEDDNK